MSWSKCHYFFVIAMSNLTIYMELAHLLATIDSKLDDMAFFNVCLELVCKQRFDLDVGMMKYFVAAKLYPDMRIFPSDVLLTYQLLPCSTVQAAFEYLRARGISIGHQLALYHEANMSVGFTLSLEALEQISSESWIMEMSMDHARWMCIAHQMYKFMIH